MSKKGNPFLLGLSVGYFLLAVVQAKNSKMLPTSLYFMIAFLSLEIALLESIRSFGKNFKSNIEKSNRFLKVMKNNPMYFCDSFNELSVEEKSAEIEKLNKNIKKHEKANAKYSKVCVMIEWVVFIGYAVIVAEMLLSVFKKVPSDFSVNRLINTMALISFSFMFFSNYMNDRLDHIEAHIEAMDCQMKREIEYTNRIYELSKSEDTDNK